VGLYGAGFDRFTRQLDVPDAHIRVSRSRPQLIGLGLTRYLVDLDPIAPLVLHYLTLLVARQGREDVSQVVQGGGDPGEFRRARRFQRRPALLVIAVEEARCDAEAQRCGVVAECLARQNGQMVLVQQVAG
jgi:hypothetical protein